MTEDRIQITLGSNGGMIQFQHDTKVFTGHIDDHVQMLQEIASYLQGYYSGEYGTRQIRVSIEEANLDYIGETERI